jgi:hypothetical protein
MIIGEAPGSHAAAMTMKEHDAAIDSPEITQLEEYRDEEANDEEMFHDRPGAHDADPDIGGMYETGPGNGRYGQNASLRQQQRIYRHERRGVQ